MRDYAKVSPQFWTKGSGKRLRGDPDAQVLALYLVTCPSANMIGIYYVPFVAIAHETGLGEKRAKAAMARLTVAGFADYDDDAELAWVPNMAAYQIGDTISGGDKRHKGVTGELSKYTGHRFAERFLETYGTAYGIAHASPKRATPGSPFQGASVTPEAPPKRKPQIREEQEQEQEQEQNKRNMSEFQSELGTPTTLSHTEAGAESADPVDVAPGTPTEAPIDPAPVSEVKASQEPSQAPPSASLTLTGVDASPRVPADVQAVFDHWMAERGKVVRGRGPKPKLDDKRRKFIASRLRTWPVAELCQAITGACATPWNRGEEGGKVFLDLELILRDAAHIERYGLAAPAKAVPRPRSDEPVSAKPAATDEELAEFFADNAAEPFAPGSDMYDEAEEAS